MRKVPSISGYALWLPSIISEMKVFSDFDINLYGL
jgi:hypothetical protein